jgi:flagellar hook-associated protein 2
MTFQLSGFSSETETFSANLQLQFGAWTDQTDAFVPKSTELATLAFTDKTLSQVAALFSDIDGISAKVIDLTGEGESFTLVVESEETGVANGFQITAADAEVENDRWVTPNDGSINYPNRQISQHATNASFELNGVLIERATNMVADVIAGVEINLKSDVAGQTSLAVTRSTANMKMTISDVVFSLNEFRTELDRLTLIDLDGDENGPLALDPAVARIKSDFKKLSVEPILGYPGSPIYMSQLGIKTNSSGEFYLDETVFERAVRETPGKFYAIKDHFTGSSSDGVDVFKSEFSSVPAGSYLIKQTDGVWTAGDIGLTKSEYNGGASFAFDEYPGVVVYTVDPNPDQFQIFIGEPFSQRVNDLMTSILDLSSSVSKAEETYKQQTIDIEERLEKLKAREELISSRYTTQFGAMETAMTQFNSTKTLLDNFIEAWKKN